MALEQTTIGEDDTALKRAANSTPAAPLIKVLTGLGASALDEAHPVDILRKALAAFGRRITLSCSFGGPSALVALDMAVRIDPQVVVTYIDTDLLFAQTHDLIARVRERYGITPRAIRSKITLPEQASLFGEELWKRNPDLCCMLRKVVPQGEALSEYDAWITGLRRDQSAIRRFTPVIEWDDIFGLVKINPLAHWTEADAWRYIREHDVPYNELHDRGYASIGCTHCTTPVMAGEPLMAGRWRGFAKNECGLHKQP